MENSNEKKDTIFCRNCGNEISKYASFCESCGTLVMNHEIRYVRPRGTGNNLGKAVAILLGGFFILISIPILFAGGALMGVSDVFNQGEGYIGIQDIQFQTSTQALIFKELDIYFDEYDIPPDWLWKPDFSDWATLRIKADSNNDDNVFIGIIEADDANAVFSDVAYDQVVEFRMDRLRNRDPHIRYRYHSGDPLEIPPTEIDVWVASVSGSGEQTLTWSPEAGNFWFIIMNEDGSSSIGVDTGVAVKIPILDNIGRALFFGGIVLLGLGVVIIYFGVIRPRY